MASEKQVAANRANANRSTGPKTKAGKAQSRKNAWKHGLTAKALVINGENPKDFELLRAAYEVQFKPQNALQLELVERLAVTTWRLRRIPVFEVALIEARRAQVNVLRFSDKIENQAELTGKALIIDSRNQDSLGKLSRYEAALLNVFNRTLHQLMLIQDREAREIEGDPVVQIPPALTPSPSVNGGQQTTQ
jgi:hypothetical protein